MVFIIINNFIFTYLELFQIKIKYYLMEFSLVIISSEDAMELSGKIKVFSLLILKGFILLISSLFSFSDNLYEFLTLFILFS